MRGRYHVGTAVHGFVIFSCYLPPSLKTAQFAEALDALGDDCGRLPHLDFVVAGNFNAKVALWSSTVTDVKGEILMEFVATHDLQVRNRECTPTSSR